MTKLEKLRENPEGNILELKEAWSKFEKEHTVTNVNCGSLEKNYQPEWAKDIDEQFVLTGKVIYYKNKKII